jgi:hypothetical protein
MYRVSANMSHVAAKGAFLITEGVPNLDDSHLAPSHVSSLVEIACAPQGGNSFAQIWSFPEALLGVGERARCRLMMQLGGDTLLSKRDGPSGGAQLRIYLCLELVELRCAGSGLAGTDRGRDSNCAEKQNPNIHHRAALRCVRTFAP